jgi:protein-L-isoaspartate O-methyltransferase
MSRSLHDAVSAEAFEERYCENPDPWNYRASAYEREKYEITIDSLARKHYASAFEPACSVGELTALLAPRCTRLLATDFSPTAVERARERVADLTHVRVEIGDLRKQLPSGRFDLIVFSEIGYYFDLETLASLGRRLADSLDSHGELIAVHWLGHSRDHLLHGDEVHGALRRTLPLRHRFSDHHPLFRVDCWLKG